MNTKDIIKRGGFKAIFGALGEVKQDCLTIADALALQGARKALEASLDAISQAEKNIVAKHGCQVNEQGRIEGENSKLVSAEMDVLHTEPLVFSPPKILVNSDAFLRLLKLDANLILEEIVDLGQS